MSENLLTIWIKIHKKDESLYIGHMRYREVLAHRSVIKCGNWYFDIHVYVYCANDICKSTWRYELTLHVGILLEAR